MNSTQHSPARDQLITELAKHMGAANGIKCDDLARSLQLRPRQVRVLISELRELGVQICGHPSSGYYIATTAQEIEDTCVFLRGRAMHSLHLEASLRRTTLPELVGQLRIDMEPKTA